ncbi:MAG TPA: phosphoadenylyl-sulfate reductase [Thermoleophilaceae bacterium]
MSAHEVLAEAVERHHPSLVMACSFQKEESVLIDILMSIEPSARVFTIDTGVLFPETYEVWRKVEERYGLHVEVMDATSPGGPWTPQNCCGPRKVAALEKALEGVDAWITGIRREQSPTRADAPKLDWDSGRGVWKFNPLADWTEKDVWNYVFEHDLPYHPLHDAGYASVGCAPCTLPGTGRDGRWAGQDKTECGLHV